MTISAHNYYEDIGIRFDIIYANFTTFIVEIEIHFFTNLINCI